MSKQHQRYLFQGHVADLRNIVPTAPEVFVCPICLRIFPPNSIEDELVNVGHVWQEYFRERSEKAKHQQVLLCRKCNSGAGQAGDERVQAFARYYEGQQSGHLGLRTLRVTKTTDWTSVRLEAFVERTGEKALHLTFPRYKKASQRRYFEEQRNKLREYAEEGSVNITVYPPHGKPTRPFGDPASVPLAHAGLLTSAYLLAFFQYGYTYIMQTCLDPVRGYIQESFNKKVDHRLDFEESKHTCVQVCSEPTHFSNDPEIGYVISIDEAVPFHLEVRFLYFHVRLPVPPITLGGDRRSLILQFLGTDELPCNGGQPLQAISVNVFVSDLDHPKLAELQPPG